uniref:Uncharacterized protein n=1 Tax=Leptobrachium leishanense TaxID=445787 RepID=A0A8C5QJQ4_9ANUR
IHKNIINRTIIVVSDCTCSGATQKLYILVIFDFVPWLPQGPLLRTKRQSHLSVCIYCCNCCKNGKYGKSKGCGMCCRT